MVMSCHVNLISILKTVPKMYTVRSSLVARRVKDLALSLLWLGLLLWSRFKPWPRNLHMLQAQPIYIYIHIHKGICKRSGKRYTMLTLIKKTKNKKQKKRE